MSDVSNIVSETTLDFDKNGELSLTQDASSVLID